MYGMTDWNWELIFGIAAVLAKTAMIFIVVTASLIIIKNEHENDR
jgi:hypothetical protein